MSGYATDREWSDKRIPALKAVVGPLLLTEAPLDVDRKQATDLIIFQAHSVMIAARVRRPGFADRYPWEFTIRAGRANGVQTELDKIQQGFAQWMVYAHADDALGLARWFVINLDAFRYHMSREGWRSSERSIRWGIRQNHDAATSFAWFDLTSFPRSPSILIGSSHPIRRSPSGLWD